MFQVTREYIAFENCYVAVKLLNYTQGIDAIFWYFAVLGLRKDY